MNSLLIITEAFGIGGVETHLRGEISHLSRNGCRVHLAIGSVFDQSLLPAEVASFKSGLALGPDASWSELVDAVDSLRSLIREHSIDCVHAHPFTSLIPAMLAAELEQVPLIITLHGPASLAPCYGPLHEFLLTSIILPKASLVVYVSDETATLAAPYRLGASSIVLANGVDPDMFSQIREHRAAPTQWLVVSRLDEEKVEGIRDFIRKAVNAGVSEITVAGDGPERVALEKSLAAEGLGRLVHFLGARIDIPELMAHADGIAGMGRVVLEAMASRKPVFLVGYDGVKGLLNTELANVAAQANFSGRNLPTIDAITFSAQLRTTVNIDVENNLALIIQCFNEAQQWKTFLKAARSCLPQGETFLSKLYREAMAEQIADTGPYLASTHLINLVDRMLCSAGYTEAKAKDKYQSSMRILMKNSDVKLERYEKLLAVREAELTIRNKRISDLNTLLSEHERQLSHSEEQLQSVLNSSSWKVTRPFRFIRSVVPRMRFGAEYRKRLFLYARRIYRWLPIPHRYKYALAIKIIRVIGLPSSLVNSTAEPKIGTVAARLRQFNRSDSVPCLPGMGDGMSQSDHSRIKPYFGVRRPHGKRRAAILTNQLLDLNDGRPRFGGGERYALELARLLKELSIDVTFFQPTHRQATTGEYYSFAVKFLSPSDTVGEFSHGLCTNFTEIAADYDHVYHHLPEYASGLMREDAIMTCHGIWFDHDNYPGAIFRTRLWFEHLYHAFHSPSAVVSVDTNSIGVIRSLWPVLAGKMKFIPNFFDGTSYYPDEAKRNKKRLTVLFPRRSQINRGSRIFGDIVSMIPHDVDIVWLGEGDPLDTEIVKAVCRKDKRASFHIADFDQMPSWYQRADIAVIPTIACEGTSLSCIEALACGCAVVSTNVGGLPDLVHDETNGLLVDPDAISISRAINRLIEDVELRERLQRNAAETASNFELGAWREKWVDLLQARGWINAKIAQEWRACSSRVRGSETGKQEQRWVILTRNAVHGGVESIIRQEAERLRAPVIVCGGHDHAQTCPFTYSRADNRRSLEKAIAEYDVILYHWIPEWALEVVKRSSKRSIEFIHRTDTSDCDKTVPSALVTHSAFLARYVFETYGRFCRVIDHPIAVQNFTPQAVLGPCVGAITSYLNTKGIDVFLRAWALLKSEFPDVPVRFYGQGDDLPRFEKLASDLGVNASFLPATSRPWEAMREYRCFVVPSRIEGLPVAVLEALASNVPVVASGLPGMVEFNELSAKRGFERYIDLATPEDEESLAQVLRDVLTREKRPDSRRYIEEYYSPEKHCSDLRDLAAEMQ